MDRCVRCETLGIYKEASRYIDDIPLCLECIEEIKLEELSLDFTDEED